MMKQCSGGKIISVALVISDSSTFIFQFHSNHAYSLLLNACRNYHLGHCLQELDHLMLRNTKGFRKALIR